VKTLLRSIFLSLPFILVLQTHLLAKEKQGFEFSLTSTCVYRFQNSNHKFSSTRLTRPKEARVNAGPLITFEPIAGLTDDCLVKYAPSGQLPSEYPIGIEYNNELYPFLDELGISSPSGWDASKTLLRTIAPLKNKGSFQIKLIFPQ
jgi:hypothetical protein